MLAALNSAGCSPDPRERLKSLLKSRYRAGTVALVGSGTQALELSLRIGARILGERSPMVALPAFGCYDIASAAIGAGAPVTFYDLDPATLGPDLASLTRALVRGARMVVAAPLYGVPFDWHRMEACALPYGALVIEDAAQGHGAEWDGRLLGSLGSMSVLSFGRGKGWTGAGGGALLIREPAAALMLPEVPVEPAWLADEAGVLFAAAAQWLLGRPALYRVPAGIRWLHLGETRYRAPSPIRLMSRASAAMLLSTLIMARREAAVRRAIGTALAAAAATFGLRPIPVARHASPGYLRYPLLVPGGMRGVKSAGRAQALGCAASYPRLIPELPALDGRALEASENYPGARVLVQDLVTLPTHSRLRLWETRAILGMLRALSLGAGRQYRRGREPARQRRSTPAYNSAWRAIIRSTLYSR